MEIHIYKSNITEGPFNESEIQQKIDDGSLLPPDLISINGGSWMPLENRNFSSRKGWTYIASGVAIADAIGRLLRRDTTSSITKSIIDFTWNTTREYGGVALFASGIAALIVGTVFSIRLGSLFPFAVTAAYMLFFVPILQLSCVEFLKALQELTKTRTFRIRTTAVPTLMLVLIGLPGIIGWGVFSVSCVFALAQGTGTAIAAIVIWILLTHGLLYALALLVTPKELGAEFGDASPGEEAMAIVGMGITFITKLTPYAVVAFILAGIGIIILGSADLLDISRFESRVPNVQLLHSCASLIVGMIVTIGTIILPISAYCLYLSLCLPLDIIRSILCIPTIKEHIQKP